jgi:hypothetical protein
MKTKKRGDYKLTFRIWSRNFAGDYAYSDLYSLNQNALLQSNWLQIRLVPVVNSEVEFQDWIVFMANAVNQTYRFSLIDRWCYPGPSNYQFSSERLVVSIAASKTEIELDINHGYSKVEKYLKGKGDMRDFNKLFDFQQLHKYQVIPFAYYFLHQGSIIEGEDLIVLNYPSGFDIENWEEEERGWEVV